MPPGGIVEAFDKAESGHHASTYDAAKFMLVVPTRLSSIE